ncbi:hypothetical protein FRB94_002964 [Tulasnella sp. JGI-2019a]|nr:hypothetical protein FRB94_002964 [Tulasnella sp. JGI-2019a]
MKLNPSETAFLTLDMQSGIIDMLKLPETFLPTMSRAITHARSINIPIIHVGVSFAPGYPELPKDWSFNPNHGFKMAKDNNMFLRGSKSTQFPEELLKEGDIVIYKYRVSAFTGNGLEMLLKSMGVRHLVLCGIATSGIVLSTVRAAYDKDFGMTILSDGCMDRDEEVHRVLTEKVFAKQANVVTSEKFIEENQ